VLQRSQNTTQQLTETLTRSVGQAGRLSSDTLSGTLKRSERGITRARSHDLARREYSVEVRDLDLVSLANEYGRKDARVDTALDGNRRDLMTSGRSRNRETNGHYARGVLRHFE